jgi:CDI immunity proteins
MADGPGGGALSLGQIEDSFWGDPPDGATRLVREAHQLRRKPVRELTAGDLRLLLSQQVGVEVLARQAVGVLREDPLAEGDYYPGDLLVAVMGLPPSYWEAHPDQLTATQQIARSVEDAGAELQPDIDRFLARTAGRA